MSDLPSYTATLTLEAEQRVRTIRDTTWRSLSPPSEYKPARPHITAIPRFSCPQNEVETVRTLLQDAVALPVSVEGIAFYPSVEEPMVVKLDISIKLGELRRRLIERIAEVGGEVEIEPVPPHITLFKSGDGDEEPDALIEASTAREMAGERGGWQTRIRRGEVNKWN